MTAVRKSFVMALCLAIPSWLAWAAGTGDVAATLQKLEKYSRGVSIGMDYAQAEKLFGSPRQKKEVADKTSGRDFTAIWDLQGYALDVSVDTTRQVASFGIHWFDRAESIPEFDAIMTGDFVTEEQGTVKLARGQNDRMLILWTKEPVPGTDKWLSLLSVMEVEGTPPK